MLRYTRSRMPYGRGDRGKRHRAWTGSVMRRPPSLRTGTTGYRYDGKPPKDNIEALNRKAQAIEARLQYLNVRIREIEQGYTARKFVAVVDTEKCEGCGMCLDACPTGAVLLEEVARIDPKRCIGCGYCAEACPQGALYLRPVEPGLQDQTGRVL